MDCAAAVTSLTSASGRHGSLLLHFCSWFYCIYSVAAVNVISVFVCILLTLVFQQRHETLVLFYNNQTLLCETAATKTEMNFKLWLYFFANWRRFIETITQLTFLHSQFDTVPKNDFPAARPGRTVSALQTKMSHHHIVCKQQHFYTTPSFHFSF